MNMNELAPPRSKFIGQQSRVIHNSARFVASIIRAGLVVQQHNTGAGKLLPHTHSQYADYVAAIETAFDAREADQLCAALT